MVTFELNIWFYTGCTLTIIGSLATVWGPGVKDPIVRTLNTEIPSVGISLMLLTYNHTLALLTFVATSVVISLILLRAITRLEEIGAEV
ncbi:MAG: EhaE family protein [Methanobrevibacter sp.]|jgi:energy-converting hydrogenase A subunit E|nr:EhaE family protein [Candidatus Methanovirga aequatorialis]